MPAQSKTKRKKTDAAPRRGRVAVHPSQAPLHGIRVLDLSAYIAGPYGCTLLADLGAQVIKIEPPAGDTLRHYPSTLAEESRAFLGTNRSKLGMVVDLKQPAGQAILRRMVESADVLVHNFRPSVPSRLGIAYEQLKTINPRLVYCALTGYGETGPLKDKAGYDQVLQSMTGICTFQGQDSGRPEIVLGSAVDFYAASLIAYGITAALHHRERTGQGQYVGVSLLRTALTMQSGRFVWAANEPRDIKRDMRSGGVTGIHPTKAGDLYLSANTPHFWAALCELVERSELAQDPKYDTVKKRAQHADEIVPKIRLALSARTALEWEKLFGDRVPCCTVRPIEDMFDHPQVLAQGLVARMTHPKAGEYRGMTKPLAFGTSQLENSFAAPVLGQHTAKVLAEHGYSAKEIESFRKAGVIEIA